MRCSSFENRFSDFIDGTLAPRKRAALQRHLDGCEACRMLIAELRVVNALLLQPRELEPMPDFTATAMGEVRSLPAPMIARRDIAPTLIAYLVFSWCVISVWLAINGPIARTTTKLAANSWIVTTSWLSIVTTTVGHTFGGAGTGVAAFSATVLALDVLLALTLYGAVVAAYPWLAAKLASPPERT